MSRALLAMILSFMAAGLHEDLLMPSPGDLEATFEVAGNYSPRRKAFFCLYLHK